MSLSFVNNHDIVVVVAHKISKLFIGNQPRVVTRNTSRSCACIVGMAGFEPATPWSQTRCATKLRYIP